MNKYWVEKEDNVDDIVAEDFNNAFDLIAEDMGKLSNTSGKSPYIGDNGNWYEWDSDSGDYIDTGVMAKGEDGENPPIVQEINSESSETDVASARAIYLLTGDINTALEEIIAIQEELIGEPEMITFNLNGTDYTCPKGMTWAELETYNDGAIWTAERLSIQDIYVYTGNVQLTTWNMNVPMSPATYPSDIIRDYSDNFSYSV